MITQGRIGGHSGTSQQMFDSASGIPRD
jgi:hypothetical protein